MQKDASFVVQVKQVITEGMESNGPALLKTAVQATNLDHKSRDVGHSAKQWMVRTGTS